MWRTLEIAGGLGSLLNIDSTNDNDGKQIQNIPQQKPSNPKGLPFPQRVPGTSLEFNPTDSNTFLVGTLAGDVLLVC